MIRSFNGKSPKIHPKAWVSEAAYVVGDVEIGEHCTIFPGAVVRGDMGKIIIGDRTNVQDNAVVHANGDITIGTDNTLGHASNVSWAAVGESFFDREQLDGV